MCFTPPTLFRGRSPLLVIALIGAAFAAGCGAPPNDELAVVAGSTHIEVILEDLAGDWITIHSLFPPATCPSQFDMKPSHIAALRDSRAVFLHPWQEAMANVREGLNTANTPGERVHILAIENNWMIPDVQQTATARIAALLDELMESDAPESAPDAHARLEERSERIAGKAREAAVRLEAANAEDAPVLCNIMQADFLEWAGFEIAGTYNAPEDLSVAAIERLLATGKEAGVVLVADNLQSGDPRAGARIAQELGAGHAVLSNFPRAVPATETWEATFEHNIEALAKALETAEP